MAARTTFAFVHENGCQKPGRHDRVLIRSHVMLGKNMRTDSRRSMRQARKKTTSLPSLGAQSVTPVRNVRSPSSGTDKEPIDAVATRLEKRMIYCGPSYAGDLSVETQWQLSEFLYWKASKQHAMPLKQYLDFGADGMTPERWLLEDNAFIHSTLFSILAYKDYSAKIPLSGKSLKHLHLALLHLNGRLSTPDAYLTDEVLHIVHSLAMAALIMGDYGAAETHVRGLQRILSLRGGRKFLVQRPKLYLLLNYLDLFWSISTSTTSLLGEDEEPIPSIFIGCLPSKLDDQDHFLLESLVEPRIASIFRDLQVLSSMINEHACSKRAMSAAQVQDWLNRITSRLLRWTDDTNSMSECLRSAMLAYLTTSMRATGRRLEYRGLADKIRKCLQANLLTLRENQDLLIWSLLVGTMAVFEAGESWLQALWQSVSSKDEVWENVLLRVERFIWLPVVDDVAGRVAFHALQLGFTRVQ